MRAHRVMLCIQVTTERGLNGQRIAGLGPQSYEAQRSMYVHPTSAITPEREPLGVLDARMWAREFKGAQGHRAGVVTHGYRSLSWRAESINQGRRCRWSPIR